MKYRCEGCMIWCEAEISDECAFVPKPCLAEFKNLTPDWRKVDENGNTEERDMLPQQGNQEGLISFHNGNISLEDFKRFIEDCEQNYDGTMDVFAYIQAQMEKLKGVR